jgi:large conductance mechanosensitive channel
MFKGFKKFILRGNVIDLAVGVVIGAAFNNMVQAVVKDLITPLIGIGGQVPDFAKLSFKIGESVFMIGDLINSVFSFLIIAAVVYSLIVRPVNKLNSLAHKQGTSDKKFCPYCLSEIPQKATRCPFCTSKLKKTIS